nr:complement component 1 Q subcomponent-binding protein, mitochondrial-like [Ciona intestinalis]|eukprot:XP_002119532.1 complement component 1 Q subcomponent-binding protein, mitochondrial-like [Ciona intestinalis]
MASALTKGIQMTMRQCSKLGNLTSRADSSALTLSSLSRLSITRCNMMTVMGQNTGRTFWSLGPTSSRMLNLNSTNQSWPHTTCGCGSYHSEGDKTLSAILNEEIAQEKQKRLSVPQIEGWKTELDGAECKVVKNLRGDEIEVSFNVNASVPPLHSDDPDEQGEIIAQPDFSVLIKKPSSTNVILFDCYFPDPENDKYEESEPENIFSIRSLTIYKDEIKESTYTIETENIDSELYSMLLTYLEDRGIGNEFAADLENLATAVENQEYIKSLEKLQKFVSCE